MNYESVHEMFSRTAEKYGPQVAIERGGQRVSYAEVEAESNRLANFLLDQGVSSGHDGGVVYRRSGAGHHAGFLEC